MSAGTNPRLEALIAEHISGASDEVDYHARWATFAPRVDSPLPALARLDLRIAAGASRTETRIAFDLDHHGPDLWAVALTGRVTLMTAGAFDALCNARNRPILDTPRGLTIPDTADKDGRVGFAAALVTRTIANPFSGAAI